MADLRRDFWIRETGTGQKVAQIHDRYMVTIIMMIMIMIIFVELQFEKKVLIRVFKMSAKRQRSHKHPLCSNK
jgi:hypothetical protein